MTETNDRLLLSHLQKGLPLVSRPFSALGAKIGLDPADVLLHVGKLKKGGFLSGIRAFWDARTFRYRCAWAAMQFAKEELDQKAALIGIHSGVIYLAERDHDFNCWFMITAPSEHDLETHFRILEKQTSPGSGIFLPLRRLLKGAEFLDAPEERNDGQAGENLQNRKLPERAGLSADEIKVIRAMQEDLPVTDEPYRQFAEASGIPAEEFLHLLTELCRKGYLKRIGSFCDPKNRDTRPRMFVAWKIPGEQLDRAAAFFSKFPEIVHADLRPGYPEFPYPVFTLIRAKDPVELEVLVRRIEDGIGKWPHRTIRTVREIKNVPVKYFPKELDAWWIRNRRLADTALQSSM